MKPLAFVRWPTTSLYENVWPGWRMTPLIFSAASFTFVIRLLLLPESEVVLVASLSARRCFCSCSCVISGCVSVAGMVTVSPVDAASHKGWAAATSNSMPTLLSVADWVSGS